MNHGKGSIRSMWDKSGNIKMDVRQKEGEKEFWDSQTKDKYAHYEKRVYSAFREKEYIEMIEKGLSGFDYKKEGRVLDMGCGAGVSSIVFSNMGFDVTGVDMSPNFIDQAKELLDDTTVSWLTASGKIENRPRFVVGDVTNLDLEDKSIDICFLGGVLHHFPNYEVILKEIQRVLKKDGIMVACEPNLFNLPYRLSGYLINRQKAVSPNDFPLSPLQVENDLRKYFKNIRLSQFREHDVPFLRQMGWFGRSIFGKIVRIITLFLKNTFASRYSRGTFFIASAQR